MLNENAKKWVAALRSGEYRQQSDRKLATVDEYKVVRHCCLGVGCEVAIKSGIHVPREEDDWDGQTIILYEDQACGLPERVRKFLGLKESLGQYGESGWLYHDNDHGKTFAEIADIIESEPPGLFVESEARDG